MTERKLASTGPDQDSKRAKARLQGPFEWTPARKLALQLVFEDALRDEDIAQKLGISRRTLSYWKSNPTFAAEWTRLSDKRFQALLQDVRRRYGT